MEQTESANWREEMGTNVSNQPMQRLLQRAGWSPVGLLHGLDEGDPELFYLCGRQTGTMQS
ncbi:hypothetical protein [Streptomyces sp. Isolate_219]|uniref:hypothetical protein n=1 Tax=Streptomyces sp. Isolate_219 TaxID=2950110 RepID=UPI0021C5CBD9|nr:hypothetical protein [Streptomyces sp. Isolate_219]MCR8573352.1 hypothetical protein [Streptomyces sp. Isolate_219]